MKNRFTIAAVGILFGLGLGAAGISWSQTTIPPQTLTKKRIIVRNIERCNADRSTLVGLGEFDESRQHPDGYVCRKRATTSSEQIVHAVAVERTCFGRALTEPFGGRGRS